MGQMNRNKLQVSGVHYIRKYKRMKIKLRWKFSELFVSSGIIFLEMRVQFESLLATRTCEYMCKGLDKARVAEFMILAWAIWKTRCAGIFQQKNCIPEKTLREALALTRCTPSRMAPVPIHVSASARMGEGPTRPLTEHVVWIDGSFGTNGHGGAAYIIFAGECLLRYEIQNFDKAISPFHMEATALLIAIKGALSLEIEICIFFTDSQILADTFDVTRKLGPLWAADWRSYSILVRIKNHLNRQNSYYCYYTSREENQQADKLANLARTQQLKAVGFTFPLFSFL